MTGISKTTVRFFTVACAALFSMAAFAAQYGPGVTDDTIKIGNTSPYSGPASAYGVIGKAVSAYFDMINDQGGINGRKIEFISYDDGYSPPKTVEQARRLVEQDHVLLLFETLGTPTNSAIHKYMNAKKVPQLFVATGASKWGQPEKYPWTMGWQPSYKTEAQIYAKYALANIKDPKIAILYQNDDYGKDYVNGFKEGLGDKTNLIVAEESYEVNEPTIASQIVNLKNSGANVFLNVTTPKFAAQAIKKAYEIGWKPTQFINNVSISTSAVLEPAGLDASTGLISAGYLKDQTDPQWKNTPEVKEWEAWMKKYFPDGNLADGSNVYGYTIAQTMVHVLKMAGDNLTRENVMKQAANIDNLELPLLLPGIKVDTGPKDYYPIECMQLQRFDGQKWSRFGDVVCAETPDT